MKYMEIFKKKNHSEDKRVLSQELNDINSIITEELSQLVDNLKILVDDERFVRNSYVLSKEFWRRSYLNKKRVNGNIYFMSIGKSVPMLDKVAATMKSLSFPAFVIDAVHILHGDFGAIGKNDIVIAASKSGHTKELNTTLEYLKSKDVQFWYMTMAGPQDDTVLDLVSNDASRCLFLPQCNELDSMNKVPTTSPIIFQIVLDAIVMHAAGNLGQMTHVDFLNNHPGGDIGKTLKERFVKDEQK